MPTNQQRREAARRKLERQLARRQEQAQARKQRTMIAGVIAAVVVIAGVIWLIQGNSSSDDTTAADNPVLTESSDASATDTAIETAPAESVPETTAPTGACNYIADGSAGTVTPPVNVDPATTGTVKATLTLGTGVVGLDLDRAKSPCAVNSLISLASQKYFDGTICHRLTTSASLKVLQCGDPTGSGSGGPGYSFGDENLDQIDTTMTYPRGTIAMANAGPDTNGSQFFLVYGDSPLAPSYTILGTIDEAGLTVLDAIAAKGTAEGGDDGKPKETVTITSLTVPEGAAAETAPAEPTDAATDLPSSADLTVDSGATDAETTVAETSAPETSTPETSGAETSDDASAAETATTSSR